MYYAPVSIVTGLTVALLVFVGLLGHVNQNRLILWGSVFLLISTLRFCLVISWKRRGTDIKRWAKIHLVNTFFAGLSWSGLVFLYSPGLPLSSQLLIIIVLVGMPIASIPGNAIYLSYYCVFSVPILVSLFFWSIFLAPDGMYLAGIDVAYSAMLFLTANVFHNSLRQTLNMRFENLSLINQLSESNLKLEKMAYIDPLTGLANRRWFQKLAQEAIKRQKRHGSKLVLMLIDVDHFKNINDTLGHEAGDRLLALIAERLNSSFRQTDLVSRENTKAARYGGDEFIVLVEDISTKRDVEIIVQRIFDKLREPVVFLQDLKDITVSIGIALIPDHADNFISLTSCADAAMYKAKHAGRNQYRFFEDNT